VPPDIFLSFPLSDDDAILQLAREQPELSFCFQLVEWREGLKRGRQFSA